MSASADRAGGAPGPAHHRDLAGRRFFCSWSGGKDAYLALQRAAAAGGRPAALLCMLHEDGLRSRGHGLPQAYLEAQAEALGVPLVTRATTWEGYEAAFADALEELRGHGIGDGVFGDIDLQGHRDWVEETCGAAGFAAHLPLWGESRQRLVEELVATGVHALIVAVDAARLGAEYLGRPIDASLIADLTAAGADVCGEEGEYHTMVTMARLFAHPVPCAWTGFEERDGHLILDFVPVTPDAQ